MEQKERKGIDFAARSLEKYRAWLEKPGNEPLFASFVRQQIQESHEVFGEAYLDERGLLSQRSSASWSPKSWKHQHDQLRRFWPKLDTPASIEALVYPYTAALASKGYRDSPSTQVILTAGEEGIFFGAKLSSIARIVKGDKGLPDYHRVLKRLLAMLSERYTGFSDWTKGAIGPAHEKPLEYWWKRRMAYEATIQGDFVAYAGQTGEEYLHWSTRAARSCMELERCQIGMTSPDVAQILLVHEDRLSGQGGTHIDCAGTERISGEEKIPSRAPYFGFRDGRLYYGTSSVSSRNVKFGSGSFRLPRTA